MEINCTACGAVNTVTRSQMSADLGRSGRGASKSRAGNCTRPHAHYVAMALKSAKSRRRKKLAAQRLAKQQLVTETYEETFLPPKAQKISSVKSSSAATTCDERRK